MKIFRGWAVVAGSVAGVGFCGQIFIATSYTILATGIASAFGWSVSNLAFGASLFLAGQVVGYLTSGFVIDRWGSLRSALAGIVLFALHLLVLTQITALWQLYAVMLSMGVFAPLNYVLPYVRAISLWFNRKRGMAIGIATSGIAVGGVLFPLGVQRIIAVGGWKQSVLAIAAVELLFCLPIVALLVRDEPRRYGLWPDGDAAPVEKTGTSAMAAATVEGATLPQALRTMEFWMLASVYFLVGLAVFAVVTNSVHILGQTAGLTTAQVAKVQAVTGISILLGRVTGGVLLDHYSDRWNGVIMNVLTALGLLGYALSHNLAMAMGSGALIGVAMGGEANVLPYMTAKYFGARAFAKIYGVAISMFGLGTALGPVTYAWLLDSTGSIKTALLILAVLTAVSAGNFLFVGRRKLY